MLEGSTPSLFKTAKRIIGNPALALSLGAVLSNRADNTQVEFLAGPSVGFPDNLVFVTLGLHVARVEKLAGDFKIGDPVPDNFPDPLPVEENFKCGLITALTFKIC